MCKLKENLWRSEIKRGNLKSFWNERLGIDCGVDEAGRGPWAGPVVAAAVILPKNFFSFELNDSACSILFFISEIIITAQK